MTLQGNHGNYCLLSMIFFTSIIKDYLHTLKFLVLANPNQSYGLQVKKGPL